MVPPLLLVEVEKDLCPVQPSVHNGSLINMTFRARTGITFILAPPSPTVNLCNLFLIYVVFVLMGFGFPSNNTKFPVPLFSLFGHKYTGAQIVPAIHR